MLTAPFRFTLEFVRIFIVDLVYASPLLLSLVMLICLIGLVIGRMEGWSRVDAIYHAFINATTVGYGDLRPTTKVSKILAVANALVGLLFTGIVVAIGLHAANHAINAVDAI